MCNSTKGFDRPWNSWVSRISVCPAYLCTWPGLKGMCPVVCGLICLWKVSVWQLNKESTYSRIFGFMAMGFFFSMLPCFIKTWGEFRLTIRAVHYQQVIILCFSPLDLRVFSTVWSYTFPYHISSSKSFSMNWESDTACLRGCVTRALGHWGELWGQAQGWGWAGNGSIQGRLLGLWHT